MSRLPVGRTFLGDDNMFTGRTIGFKRHCPRGAHSGFGPVPAA
jgi:hypothetical protein